jgi:hypothetical protein
MLVLHHMHYSTYLQTKLHTRQLADAVTIAETVSTADTTPSHSGSKTLPALQLPAVKSSPHIHSCWCRAAHSNSSSNGRPRWKVLFGAWHAAD